MVKRTGPDLKERKTDGVGDAQGRLSGASAFRHVPRSLLDVQPSHPPLSTVIWDFAEPLLRLGEEPSLGAIRESLAFAISIWGAVILEQQGDDPSALNELRDQAFKWEAASKKGAVRSYELLDLIDRFRQRKLSRYGGDHRACLSFEVSETEEGHHLVVTSYDLDEEHLGSGPSPSQEKGKDRNQ